ncbi:MAG: hypothetical protein V3T08_09585 [Gemmatimonadota bacterium]
MTKDFNGLEVELTSNQRYDAAVQGTSLQPLMALLNEEDPASAFVYFDVPVSDILEAAGQAKMAALTQDERNRLIVLKDEGTVAISKPAIRAELLDVFGITESQLVAGIPSVRRRARYGEAFGFALVTKEDLWKVLPNIPKSHTAKYLAGLL